MRWLPCLLAAFASLTLARSVLAQSPPGDAAPNDQAGAEPAPEPEAPPEPEASTARVRTGIAGQVLDAATGEPVIEAPVLVVSLDRRTLTDIDGNFSIEVRPGTYTLRSYYDLYRPTRVENVTVTRGQVTSIEIRLPPDTEAVQEVVVTARADRNTEATQLQVRRSSTAVSDSVSAQEIARSPDSTAGESARRVVAATIVDGQYLFVRGLGGRYTSVLLNGVTLPSLDPDYPGVPLDLFPASLLTSMTVIKTFSTELPGDFAGGLMVINTREYPTRFNLGTSLTLGANTRVTGRKLLAYDGGGTDWLGCEDGTRAFPDAVPGRRVESGRHGLPADQIERIGEAFPNHWAVHRTTGLPNLGVNATIGNTSRLAGRDLGYLLSLGFTHTTRNTEETLRRIRLEGEGNDQSLNVSEELHQQNSTQDALLGALGTLSYGLTESDELSLVGLWTSGATDSTIGVDGYSDANASRIESWRMRFTQRRLGFAQLMGDHRALPLGAHLRWQVNAASASRREPDTRDLLYQEAPEGYQWREEPGSGEHFWANLDQTDVGGGVDLTVPVGRLTVKAGALTRITDRNFLARRFGFQNLGLDASELDLPPEELFGPEHIGPDLRLRELTAPTDGYDASQRLFAEYVSLEVPLFGGLRAAGGIRAEGFSQHIQSSSPFASDRDEAPPGTDRTDVDVLPSAALVYEVVPNLFARLAYGGTVARPQVRELVPFLYQDFVRRRTVAGNPDLERTYIHNLDHRWEYFPSDREVLAASVFYKSFQHPIEQVVVDRNGNITYENAESATNFGAELEARLSLGRLAAPLEALSLGANLALIASRIDLSADQALNSTNRERPLAGQSPYVANVSLGIAPPDSGLSLFAYYNVFGRRIEDVGRLGLPDVYQEPFHGVDVTLAWEPSAHVSLKLSAKNLLDQPVVLDQGGIEIRSYRPGPSFSLRLGVTH